MLEEGVSIGSPSFIYVYMKDYFSRINPTVKGITLAFIATLGMANVYVFSKAALLEVSYFQFQFYWFGFAIIWIVPFLFITGIIKKIPKLSRSSRITMVIIGILELGSSTMMFLAIYLAENPTTISFLSNLTPIFVTILGIRFLGERFNAVEAMGIILTIGGVILISYVSEYNDNADALAGGEVIGTVYRTGDLLKIVH